MLERAQAFPKNSGKNDRLVSVRTRTTLLILIHEGASPGSSVAIMVISRRPQSPMVHHQKKAGRPAFFFIARHVVWRATQRARTSGSLGAMRSISRSDKGVSNSRGRQIRARLRAPT